MEKMRACKIMGIGLPVYLLIAVVTAAAMCIGWLPSGMLGRCW